MSPAALIFPVIPVAYISPLTSNVASGELTNIGNVVRSNGSGSIYSVTNEGPSGGGSDFESIVGNLFQYLFLSNRWLSTMFLNILVLLEEIGINC